MKKALFILLAATMSVAMLAGCSSTTESTTATETTTEVAGLSGTVTVGGSTSVESVILSAIEIFCEANPDVTITYDPTGSSTGVKSAASGDYDIGLASRDVKESETTDYGTVGTVFAIDGIAIIVNNDNSVADLSVEDVAAIASGEITNWADLGGDDSPIVLIGREAGSGTRDGFESIVGVEDCVYEQELSSTGGVIGAVQQNVYAIGYASVASVSDTVKALTIEGVEANEANIQDGSYKFQRNFNFVTVDGTALSAAAQGFYDFVLSADASELISNAGAVPTV
ncbi:phosphate ABC transporter substrate-binding protein [Bengtsoniella intestinalis]|uniref:phosphate ABC transporter substrate-binding protein n=1 Tax=Bengtsoniella intestinalis TaxID=3073143 RepID=UPI00391F66E9